jgi:CheY-like chemotaxis protein
MRDEVLAAGFRPICACDGSEAVAAITHEKPALVLIDGALPELERRWLLARMERSAALARILRAVLPPGGRVAFADAMGGPWRAAVAGEPMVSH